MTLARPLGMVVWQWQCEKVSPTTKGRVHGRLSSLAELEWAVVSAVAALVVVAAVSFLVLVATPFARLPTAVRVCYDCDEEEEEERPYSTTPPRPVVDPGPLCHSERDAPPWATRARPRTVPIARQS